MTKLESSVETRLRVVVEEQMGGMCLKLLTNFVTGLPDRLVLLPDREIYFVELKRKGKTPRKIQAYIHRRLMALGFEVLVIDSVESVNTFRDEKIRTNKSR